MHVRAWTGTSARPASTTSSSRRRGHRNRERVTVFVLLRSYDDDGPYGYDEVSAVYLHEAAAVRRRDELNALAVARVKYWITDFQVQEDA